MSARRFSASAPHRKKLTLELVGRRRTSSSTTAALDHSL